MQSVYIFKLCDGTLWVHAWGQTDLDDNTLSDRLNTFYARLDSNNKINPKPTTVNEDPAQAFTVIEYVRWSIETLTNKAAGTDDIQPKLLIVQLLLFEILVN